MSRVQSRRSELSVPMRRVTIAASGAMGRLLKHLANAAFHKVAPHAAALCPPHFAMARLAGGPFSPSPRIQDPKSLHASPSPASLCWMPSSACDIGWRGLWAIPRRGGPPPVAPTAEDSCSPTTDPAESPELKPLWELPWGTQELFPLSVLHPTQSTPWAEARPAAGWPSYQEP